MAGRSGAVPEAMHFSSSAAASSKRPNSFPHPRVKAHAIGQVGPSVPAASKKIVLITVCLFFACAVQVRCSHGPIGRVLVYFQIPRTAPVQSRPMLPIEHNDPINAKILAISDKIEGFVRSCFRKLHSSGVPRKTAMERIAATPRAGTVRGSGKRLATNLADGALVAWKVAQKVSTPLLITCRMRSLTLSSCAPPMSRLVQQALDNPEGSPRILARHHGELLAEDLARTIFD